MAIKIGDNFGYKGEKFNFDRDAAATLEELQSVPVAYFPDRFTTYVVSEDKYYRLYKTPLDGKSGWTEVTYGDGSGDETKACYFYQIDDITDVELSMYTDPGYYLFNSYKGPENYSSACMIVIEGNGIINQILYSLPTDPSVNAAPSIMWRARVGIGQFSEFQPISAGGDIDLSAYAKTSMVINLDKATNLRIDALQADFDKRFPFVITSFSGGGNYKKGISVNPSLAWVYDGTPTTQSLAKNGSVISSVLITDRTYKDTSSVTSNTTYRLTANGLIKEVSVAFYNPKYIGAVTTAPTTAIQITDNPAFSELGITPSKGHTWNGDLNNQSICYTYPKAFGALTSIKDANGFDYIEGYARTELTVNGEVYYVYTSSKSTITGFRQIFA